MRTLVLLCGLVVGTPATADDFRGLEWGASPAAVKKAEKAKPVFEAKDGGLAYKDTVAGLDVLIIYEFDAGRMVSGSYHNKERHTNKSDFIADFNKLKELLTKKYGAPMKDQQVWRNDLYKDDPPDWGMAVAVGHLIYRVQWENERTKVVNSLRGDKFEITHIIVYREKASEEELKEKEEKKTLDKL